MAKPKNENEQYDEKEAKRRFEQALRGARLAGHKPLKDVPKKKSKKQRAAEKKTRDD